MSIFDDFNRARLSEATVIIGDEPIRIGEFGAAVSAVLNETADNRDYEDAGFSRTTTLDAVVCTVAFTLAYPNTLSSYIGQTVYARGMEFRLAGTGTRPGATVLSLQDTRRAS